MDGLVKFSHEKAQKAQEISLVVIPDFFCFFLCLLCLFAANFVRQLKIGNG